MGLTLFPRSGCLLLYFLHQRIMDQLCMPKKSVLYKHVLCQGVNAQCWGIFLVIVMGRMY